MTKDSDVTGYKLEERKQREEKNLERRGMKMKNLGVFLFKNEGENCLKSH